MTRLAWGAAGTRLFETGLDRGVLYRDNMPGVPWNGLKAVNEVANGGEPRPYYIDGYKYLNLASAEEFAATITAFGCPLEFLECDGTARIHNGLFATQQPRKSFGLSYRTLIGNDRSAEQHGYKIHLVYNALAQPSARNNQTYGTSATPLDLSWGITTQPPRLTGYRPTAHFVIDSTHTPPALMTILEDILYGTEGEDPRLPEVEELSTLFSNPGPIVARNLAANPDAVGINGYNSSGESPATISQVDDWIRFTFVDGAAVGVNFHMGIAFTPGTMYRQLIEARANKPLRASQRIGQSTTGPLVDILVEAEMFDANIVAGSNAGASGFLMHSSIPWVAGDYVEVRKTLYSDPSYTGPHFSGATPDTERENYSWEGAPDNSSSIMRSWY